MTVVIAVDGTPGRTLAAELRRAGIDVRAVLPASALAMAAEDGLVGVDAAEVWEALTGADAIVLEVHRSSLTAQAVAACDRRAVRIVPVCAQPADERLAASFGLSRPHGADADGWAIAADLGAQPRLPVTTDAVAQPSRVIAVWGAAGSPGRSTLAVELAVELARGGNHVGLIDADTHAPSLALSLGLADEGPGFAAACRQAELGGLDAAELTRISASIPDAPTVDVLTGLNRPSRWPELSEARVSAALSAARRWAPDVVVDVAASLERDEEIVSDLDGPRRNAATLASVAAADLVIAVVSADPLGVARFVRGCAELRAAVGTTPIAVVANRLRPGALGIDARGQIRRALDRFAGVEDVAFLPLDPRSADSALLAARPVAAVAPRSPLTLAVRRFVADAVHGPSATVRATERRRFAREPRPA